MKRIGAWVLAAAALGGAGPGSAQSADGDVPPGTLAEALDRAYIWSQQSHDETDKSHSLDACLKVLDPWMDEARRTFVHHDDPYPWTYAICKFSQRRDGPIQGTEADVRAWLAPWLALLQGRSQSQDPLLAIKWRIAYHWNISSMGFRDVDAPRFEHEVEEMLLALKAEPTNKLVYDELAFLVRCYFGEWRRQDELRRVHAMFTEVLGEGHRFSLLMLRAIAYHERFLGRPSSALEAIERAKSLTRSQHADDVMLNAHMATEYAACLSSAGRLVEAAEQMRAARLVFEAQKPTPHASLTRIDYNLAGIALEMSDFDGAIAYADSSIEQAQLSGEPNMLIEARVPRATKEVARMQLGHTDAAAKLKEVLIETRGGEMHIGGQAFALVEYAVAHGDQDLLDWATEFADRHIRRFSGPMTANTALRPLMQAWRTSGAALTAESAGPLLDRALAISLNERSLGTLALTQFKMAQHTTREDPDTAIWLYKRGANALQKLRTGLPSSEPELHRSWLGAHETDLRSFVGLLVDTGRLVEAEQALAVLRDEESHEYSRRSRRTSRTSAEAQQSLSYTPVEAARNKSVQKLSLEAEASAAAADHRMDARKTRTGLWSDYVDPQAESDVTALVADVHRLVREAPAAARAVDGPRPSAEKLPPNTARITYFVRDDNLTIVLQRGRNHLRRTVHVSRAELNRTVQLARSALGSPQLDALPALQTLHRWLVEPVQGELKRGLVKNIIWVPDAALRYLPFAALHDGRRYLAQNFVMQTRWTGLLSAPKPRGAQTRMKAGRVVAFGRSLGDDQHSALPGVQEELASTRRAGGQTWLDEQFTEEALRNALNSSPGTVHLATHFELDPGGEEKSYLLLGNGHRMSLAALADLPWTGVRLALLSACDSGVSFDWGTGQAQVGFAASLGRAGVENVLATLWRISDGASANWVSMFYASTRTNATQPGTQPDLVRFSPEHVASTQRRWLRQYAGQPLGHPHYWAAFVWLRQ